MHNAHDERMIAIDTKHVHVGEETQITSPLQAKTHTEKMGPIWEAIKCAQSTNLEHGKEWKSGHSDTQRDVKVTQVLKSHF